MQNLFIIITVVVLSFSSCNAQTKPEPKQYSSKGKELNASTRKNYSNDKMGITFQFPDTWIKQGEESNVVNRKGEVMAILVNFSDTTAHSFFSVEYHFPPYGAELFRFSEAQFDSSQSREAEDAKRIKVAGNSALETFTVMTKDIKGNVYDPPLQMVSVIFLDKQRTGEFALHFRTPVPNKDEELGKFKELLATLKFLD